MEETKEYRPSVEFGPDGRPVPRSLAEAAYHVLDRRNAEELTILYLGEDSGLTDYFVICSARSVTMSGRLPTRRNTGFRSPESLPTTERGRATEIPG